MIANRYNVRAGGEGLILRSGRGEAMERTAAAGLLADETESEKPLYPPSWVDRVTDWVRQLPVPAWLFYLALGLVLVFLHAIAKWSDGSYPAGTFSPFQLISDLSPVFALAVMHYFDNWAEMALATFRPAMTIDGGHYTRLRYQLTTLPRLQTLIASFIGAAYGPVALLLLTGREVKQFSVFTSPLGSVLDVTFSIMDYLTYAVLIYHTIHQMRVVNCIYTTYTHVDLFQLKPLYALSTLTARTTIGMAILAYGWFSVLYFLSPSPSIVGILEPAFFIPFLAGTFLLPPLGIHRMLEDEKGRMQSEAALHLKAACVELHRRREGGDYGQIDAVGKAIDGLMKEQSVIDKIPTWPWRSETLRWVGTTLLLPIILVVATHELQHFLGF